MTPSTHIEEFTPPKTFVEFYERYPKWVKFLSMKLLHRRWADDDVQDLEQELLLHLSTLPESSVFSHLGASDRIGAFLTRTYDRPVTAGMFFYFVKLLCVNRFATMRTSAAVDAMSGKVSLERDEGGNETKGGPTARKKEWWHDQIEPASHYAYIHLRREYQSRLRQFRTYVAKTCPDLLNDYDSFVAAGGLTACAEELGWTASERGMFRRTLRKLADRFNRARE